MAEDKMQLQRFELKYRIKSEEMAVAVRDFVSCHLEVDEYGATLPQYSYPVHSLYLDSPRMKLYWDTINGTKNRFKLRLRFYENRAEAPVYFEIKRRMNNIIAKQRGGVRRDAVDLLLAGHLPEPAHLVSRDPKHLLALQNFCHLSATIQAQPRTHIAYLREAWLSPYDNSVRVTLDRQVRTELEPTTWLSTQMRHPIFVFGSDIILELKFTNRFPNWFGDLVRHFGLMQCGAAKYVEGVARLGADQVASAFALDA
jgi:SPX domain protein involved in polyphosphate accumulation